MNIGFGPLDQMLGLLLETWDERYAFKVDWERRAVLFTRAAMQAAAREVERGLVRVAYESASHEVAEEFCTPETAASLTESRPPTKRSLSHGAAILGCDDRRAKPKDLIREQ
jgi:hypothetical protein